MARFETREILVTGANGETAVGILRVRCYDRKDRVLGALGMLGLFWLLAVLAIPIIGLHFILVPAFLVLGPVMAWRRYQMSERNEQVSGECPVCHRPMSLPLDSSDRLPLHAYCPPSGDPIRLTDESAAQA